MLYFEVYKAVVVSQFNCCSCHFFHWMCWETTQRCCSSCSWCLSPCQRLHTIIHRSIKMTLKTYPFLTCLESLERLMYKTKVVFNHWNDQNNINNSPMTPLNHPQIHQDDLEDMTLHAMLGVTVESVENYMISTFFWSFQWFRTSFPLYITLSSDSKYVKKWYVLQVILMDLWMIEWSHGAVINVFLVISII